jgi:hypothetical protein
MIHKPLISGMKPRPSFRVPVWRHLRFFYSMTPPSNDCRPWWKHRRGRR